MARVRDSIGIAASCEAVFDQLVRFEEYPRFMAGVLEVRRRDESHLQWRAETNGRVEEWESEIIENIPPHRLAWRARERVGLVTCRTTPWGSARVFFDMDLEPLQVAADGRHYIEATLRRMHANLENFKEWVEEEAEPSAREEATRAGPILPA